MVIFEKNRVTIVIEDWDEAEAWTEIIDELLDLLINQNAECIEAHPNVLRLLQCMMPDWKQVKTMRDVAPEKKE